VEKIAPGSNVQLFVAGAVDAAGSSSAGDSAITDPVLQELSGEFHRLCAAIGQPSIAREKLLGAAVAGMADAEDLESRQALGSELHQNAAQRKSPVLTMV
jgi:hypothetical protein